MSRETAVLPNGRLYDMGHYPMLVPAQAGEVHGQVLTVAPHLYERILGALDHLEGFDPAAPQQADYRRELRAVRANGRDVSAWVYIGRARFVNGCAPIPHGNWPAYAARKKKQMARWWANVQSVRGLHGPTGGGDNSGP